MTPPTHGILAGMLQPDPQLTCSDCGGRAFLLSPPREDGVWVAGDIVAYRCEDCLDRWDLVLDDDDEIARGDEPTV